jgi:excisionase family DNA binding protein
MVVRQIQLTGSPDNPTIEGSRMTVQDIAKHYAHFDWPVDRIAEAFHLSPAEVHAALSYYYTHQDRLDASIEAEFAEGDKVPENAVDGWSVVKGRKLPIMTIAEVAEEYGLSDATIRNAIRKGWLPAHKAGGTWLVNREDAASRWGK